MSSSSSPRHARSSSKYCDTGGSGKDEDDDDEDEDEDNDEFEDEEAAAASDGKSGVRFRTSGEGMETRSPLS